MVTQDTSHSSTPLPPLHYVINKFFSLQNHFHISTSQKQQMYGLLTINTSCLHALGTTNDIFTVTEGLAESASHFRVSARRLERKMWWKNCKV